MVHGQQNIELVLDRTVKGKGNIKLSLSSAMKAQKDSRIVFFI
jgi:hypothetical protein